MKVFIDLETIPTQNENQIEFLNSKLKPPANYKSQEAKDKWMLANKDSNILKTSFDGSFGQICTIGYAIDDGEIKTIQRRGEVSDKVMIAEFISRISAESNLNHTSKQPYFIAHNKEFDLRFLFHRMIVNKIDGLGVNIPVDDRYNKYSFCTMVAWKGFGAKAGGSLDAICQSLGIDGKKGMTGADVWPAYQNEEYDRIAEYCADDVRALREIYNRVEPYY